MKSLDEIIEMLDWSNNEEIQKKGIELGSKIKHLEAFILPYYKKNKSSTISDSKSIWENCAKIICEKKDEELSPYIYKIFKWLEDLNFPGAILIFNRLIEYNKKDFDEKLEYQIKKIYKD